MKVNGNYYKNGYAHLQGLIPAALTTEFLANLHSDLKSSSMSLTAMLRPAHQLKRPAVELYGYQYKPMVMFLWGLTPIMRDLTGRDLLPTFSYFRAYQRDDVCWVHSDREACEHSLSMTLAYSDDAPWALDFAAKQQERKMPIAEDFEGEPYASVTMLPGDAVLYQGVHYRHGRVTPNPNRWSAHMFLHWVDSAGPYRSLAFDKQSIGATTAVDFELKQA
jgi:hypothetical protein